MRYVHSHTEVLNVEFHAFFMNHGLLPLYSYSSMPHIESSQSPSQSVPTCSIDASRLQLTLLSPI